MSDGDWLAIYRTYDSASLQARIDALKAEISVYASQSIGQKSYEKNLQELKLQLSAAIRAQQERRFASNSQIYEGTVDFTFVNSESPPYGGLPNSANWPSPNW